MTLDVSANDLDLLLDLDGTIDDDRASLLISMATNLCASIISPVPDNADVVVLGVAARAYLNPAGVQSETLGPETVQYGSSMVGVYLTTSDVTTLKRLGGAGGAFSVQVMPDDAGCDLPIWDRNIWDLDDDLLIGGEWSGL